MFRTLLKSKIHRAAERAHIPVQPASADAVPA